MILEVPNLSLECPALLRMSCVMKQEVMIMMGVINDHGMILAAIKLW